MSASRSGPRNCRRYLSGPGLTLLMPDWFPAGSEPGFKRPVSNMLPLGKYSFGMGDRFAHQARAQLRACIKAAEQGVEVIPVWNKSNREHITIGSEPSSVPANSARPEVSRS